MLVLVVCRQQLLPEGGEHAGHRQTSSHGCCKRQFDLVMTIEVAVMDSRCNTSHLETRILDVVYRYS